MDTDPLSDAKIVESWGRNVVPWTRAVREERIESRRLVTDRAIIDAILSRSPSTVLDLGCGEGWLVRALAARGIRAVGIDGVPALIEQARKVSRDDFYMLSYEELAAGEFEIHVDVAVCNFALFGQEAVEGLFRVIPLLLNPQGSFIVQTLHPLMACGDLSYQDGWREGSWEGFDAEFTHPAPWYFRTLETWVKLFLDSGLRRFEMREPIHPKTHKPASAIFMATLSD